MSPSLRRRRGGGKRRRRRRSLGTSRFSMKDRHVVEAPVRIVASNVRRFVMVKMKKKEMVEALVRIIAATHSSILGVVSSNTLKQASITHGD